MLMELVSGAKQAQAAVLPHLVRDRLGGEDAAWSIKVVFSTKYELNQTRSVETIMEHPQVISVHEYELKPGVEGIHFERAFQEAEARGLFSLSGLVEYHFVRGIRGVRRAKYAVIWIYESKEAWEQLWGPIDQPVPKDKYPQKWLIWENEVLSPFLSQDPDKIRYTSYLAL